MPLNDMKKPSVSFDKKNPNDNPGSKKSPLDKTGKAKGSDYKGPGTKTSWQSDNPLNSGGNKLHKSAVSETAGDPAHGKAGK